MNKLIVLSLLVACAFARPQRTWTEDWEEWKSLFGKKYIKEEELKRKMIWEENLKYVTKHNYGYDNGLHTFTLGMTKFADMTNDEYKNIYLSPMRRSEASDCRMKSFNYTSLPGEVDWSKKGYVTPVKNQLQCGSCWAFSTTGSVEGQHFKATGKLVSLSEQNLVDCSGPEGDLACAGGLMDYAFEYIITNHGIDTEASYPYEARKGECRFNPANVGATITACFDITKQSESDLQGAVASIGPISVAIDASHLSFQLYKEGVYYESNCSETVLDHGVLAVGYGTEKNKDYWLVKNSWGTDWGMDGYLMMSRNRDNNCGIATSASYPKV